MGGSGGLKPSPPVNRDCKAAATGPVIVCPELERTRGSLP
jgi:hypothetical protein